MTVVIFGSDGRGATNVRLSGAALGLSALAAVSALAGALWIGWKIGELTALL
jgi:hypothetical protein